MIFFERRQRLTAFFVASVVSLTVVVAAPADAATPDPIHMVGDSLTWLSRAEQPGQFDQRGWGPSHVDGYPSRSVFRKVPSDPRTGIEAVDHLRNTFGDRTNWVVAFGTNDSGLWHPDEYVIPIRAMLDHIGAGRRVMWVNIHMPDKPERAAAWNGALDQVAGERPDQLVVYDWNRDAAANPHWLGHDRVHYTAAGYTARAALIADAAARLLPPPESQRTNVASTTIEPVGDAGNLTVLAPLRALDTRLAGSGGRFAAGETRAVDLADLPARTVAAALNLTTVDATDVGFLTAFPCGTTRPFASMNNYTPVGASGSATTVAVADRRVCIFASAETEVIVDVFGAFVSDGGDRFTPVAPTRVVDTRPAEGGSGLVGAGRSVSFNIGSASAAIINLTTLGSTGPGYLTVYPCTGGVPGVSNVNYRIGGAPRANQALAVADSNGDVCVYSHDRSHVIVDVFGTFTPDGLMEFQPADIVRVLDTRDGTGGWIGRTGAGQTIDVAVNGLRGMVVSGMATVADPASDGFVAALSGVVSTPRVSNLNFASGDVVPNSVIAEVSGGDTFSLFSSAGNGHLIFDVTGWFAPTLSGTHRS